MDAYEVDLRDYILVLWRRKWLVVAVFLVALVAALGATLRTPTSYRATMVLASTETAPLNLPRSFTSPSLETVRRWAMHPPLLDQVAEGLETNGRWLSESLQVSVDRSFLSVTLEDRLGIELQERILARLSQALNRRAAEDLLFVVRTESDSLSLREERLRERLGELDQELEDLRVATERQRDKLLQEISETEAEIAALEARFGEVMNLEGYMADKRLDALFTRLGPVQATLDGIERRGTDYIAEREVAGIKQDLKDIEDTREALLGLQENPPQLLQTVMGPTGTGRTIRPRLTMNLSVAGVLGIFVGVLLAFFVHAMRQDEDEPATPAQTRASGENA